MPLMCGLPAGGVCSRPAREVGWSCCTWDRYAERKRSLSGCPGFSGRASRATELPQGDRLADGSDTLPFFITLDLPETRTSLFERDDAHDISSFRRWRVGRAED